MRKNRETKTTVALQGKTRPKHRTEKVEIFANSMEVQFGLNSEDNVDFEKELEKKQKHDDNNYK